MAVLDTAILLSTDGLMFEHPVLNAVRTEGFVPLGWFQPKVGDGVPHGGKNGAARFVILIGNAGPHMFARFAREKIPGTDSLDDWCRAVLDPLAETLGGRVLSVRQTGPALSHLGPARRRCTSVAARPKCPSRLRPVACLPGRVRISGSVRFSCPAQLQPSESCADKPCLAACPVGAFDGHCVCRRDVHGPYRLAARARLFDGRLPGAPGLSRRPAVRIRSAAGAVSHAGVPCRASTARNRREFMGSLIGIGILAALALWAVSIYNGLVSLRQRDPAIVRRHRRAAPPAARSRSPISSKP